MGFIIMEPADTPPMSGSNSICVATVLLDTGIVPMTEPETRLVLEAPGGLVEIVAQCRNGKAERITVTNVPSFADKLDAQLEVEGVGTLTVDTAYGGDSFVIVDAPALGFAVTPRRSPRSRRRPACASPAPPTSSSASRIRPIPTGTISPSASSRCRSKLENGVLTAANAVAIRPGKIDRSPTGTGVSARMAGDARQGRDAGRATAISRARSSVRSSSATSRRTRRWPASPRSSRRSPGRAWISGTRIEMIGPCRPLARGLSPLRYMAQDARMTTRISFDDLVALLKAIFLNHGCSEHVAQSLGAEHGRCRTRRARTATASSASRAISARSTAAGSMAGPCRRSRMSAPASHARRWPERLLAAGARSGARRP